MKRIIITTLLLIMILLPLALSAAPRQVVKEAEVRQFITDYLKQRSGESGLSINVRKIGYAGDLVLPAGVVDYEVIAPDRWEGWGNANLGFIVRVNDHVEKNLSIRVEVEALADMVVAVRALDHGDVIGQGDVALAKRDVSKVQGKFCRSLDEVVGMKVRTGIRGNNPIKHDNLERVPLIKSGQLVTILVENESIRITAPGKARNAGAVGDAIIVQNLSSLKELTARVLDAATVKIEF